MDLIAGRIVLFVVCCSSTVPSHRQAMGADNQPAPAAGLAPTFESAIRPIFKANCFQCHGEMGAKEGKLDLRLARLAKAGGKSGPSIIPGRPDESYLLDRIKLGEMPPGKKPLAAAEIAAIEAWIVAGAKTARPEPADPDGLLFTAEERAHWAYQPIQSPAPPQPGLRFQIRGPIDAFLAAKLAKRGITSFSSEASRQTYIRRVTFDLLGLPPTPEEIASFEADASPAAYEKLVDRLLASPHYGERWARHWLDVAGYAESDVRFTKDQPRDWAWKYRDYVIKAFNADMPWDRFIVEQLAADEMAPGPLAALPPERAEALAAVSFLRMAPDNTQAENSTLERNRAVAEMIKVASSAFLGLTVGCAECHDHRYDPISTADYYRFRAVFDPAFDIRHWKLPGERVIRVTPMHVRAKIDEIEAKAAALEKRVLAEEQKVAQGILERELLKVPENQRAILRQAVALADNKRTPEQQALLKRHLTVRPIGHIIGLLVEYDRKAFQQLKTKKEEVAKLRATKPGEEYVGVPMEAPNHSAASRVFFRGDFDQPKQPVTPAEPAILALHRTAPDLPAKDPKCSTSGRRLALARRLTDGRHPLVARVLVNRFWMHHFGRGIVATPGDFGKLGELPTHPELLDWLANDFMAGGWRLKRLHKSIVLSTAYRQSSRRTTELDRIDPENRWLGRMNVRRLEAEAVRDALLAVAGDLSTQMFGPSIPVVENGDGKAIIGKQKLAKDGLFYGDVDASGPEASRRSIYIQALRVAPYDMLDTFDAPGMAPNCEARKSTTVATQSLLFLNDSVILERADRLAKRLMRNVKRRLSEADVARVVRQAHWLLYGRGPTPEELGDCQSYLAGQTAYFQTHGDAAWKKEIAKSAWLADQRALASLCQALFCANEFLYVD